MSKLSDNAIGYIVYIHIKMITIRRINPWRMRKPDLRSLGFLEISFTICNNSLLFVFCFSGGKSSMFFIFSMLCFIMASFFSSRDTDHSFNVKESRTTNMAQNPHTPLIITTGLKDKIKEGGSIVIVSSNDAYPGAFSSMSYSISKSALLSLMKCLSVNYGAKGIRVNSVAPGAIDTDMNTEEQMEISPYFSPIARVGTPEDVAKVVFFLSSDEAGFISGENVTIDGGYSTESVLLKSEADPNLSILLRKFIAHPEIIDIIKDYPKD